MKLKLALILLAGLSSCKAELGFDGEIPVPRLVVNSVIDADSNTFSINVSSSRFALDKAARPISPEVKISISGNSVPLVKKTAGSGHYIYTGNKELLKPGDEISITCSSEGYSNIIAEERAPSRPIPLSAKGEWIINEGEGKDKMLVRLRFRDYKNEHNYYRLIVRSRTIFPGQEAGGFILKEVMAGSDPVLAQINNTLKQEDRLPYVIFPDELIDGREYELIFYYKDECFEKYKGSPLYIPGTKYEAQVELQALSKNLYLYMSSFLLNRNNDAFSEPVKVHSNITGGYGIAGIFSPVQMPIEINN